MKPRFKIGLHKEVDSTLLQPIERIFHGENLLQTILHAHLLVERALAERIREKLVRPEILDGGKYGRWSFSQKLALFVGVCNPSQETEEMLFELNKLRNATAHSIHEDEEACVARCLSWRGETSPRPDALVCVRGFAVILLFDLGVLKSVERLHSEGESV